uniref:Uncharacterized protein n=1 Tax=Rhizophora mucronata TaxID=61149 RepID=A0A2P2PKH7_RHIMU
MLASNCPLSSSSKQCPFFLHLKSNKNHCAYLMSTAIIRVYVIHRLG